MEMDEITEKYCQKTIMFSMSIQKQEFTLSSTVRFAGDRKWERTLSSLFIDFCWNYNCELQVKYLRLREKKIDYKGSAVGFHFLGKYKIQQDQYWTVSIE